MAKDILPEHHLRLVEAAHSLQATNREAWAKLIEAWGDWLDLETSALIDSNPATPVMAHVQGRVRFCKQAGVLLAECSERLKRHHDANPPR